MTEKKSLLFRLGWQPVSVHLRVESQWPGRGGKDGSVKEVRTESGGLWRCEKRESLRKGWGEHKKTPKELGRTLYVFGGEACYFSMSLIDVCRGHLALPFLLLFHPSASSFLSLISHCCVNIVSILPGHQVSIWMVPLRASVSVLLVKSVHTNPAERECKQRLLDSSGRLNSCWSVVFSSGPICNSWGEFLQPTLVNTHYCEWRYFSFCLLHVRVSLDEKCDADVSEGPLVW